MERTWANNKLEYLILNLQAKVKINEISFTVNLVQSRRCLEREKDGDTCESEKKIQQAAH